MIGKTMQKHIIYCLFPILVLVGLRSIGAAEQSDNWKKQQREYRQETEDARRIDTYAAFNIFRSGKALLISADSPEYYKRRRIVGSINIPEAKFGDVKLKVPKDTPIIIYCR